VSETFGCSSLQRSLGLRLFRLFSWIEEAVPREHGVQVSD